MNKHAYLIMYHDDFYILEKLLKQIDSVNHDIYLHIDKKVKNVDYLKIKDIVKKSNIYISRKINVKWSTSSQIKCELHLLKEAVKNKYSYYHLLSGNDLLIKDKDEIYNFFEQNKGYEYVAFSSFDNISDDILKRVKYYHFLNGYRRDKNKIINKLANVIHFRFIKLQEKLKVNRLKNNNLNFRKGANWFSITNDLANFVLKQEKEILKTYSFTNCSDELFLQTIVYNSKFKKKLYKKYNQEHGNIKRYIDWNRGEPYTYTIEDYSLLINSEAFFARKFSSRVDKDIIDKIYDTYK